MALWYRFIIEGGLKSGFLGNKDHGDIALDVMINGLKMSFGEIYKFGGASENLRFGSDVMFDQYKAEVKEYMNNHSSPND